jgi:hypothetical protein
MNLMAERYDLKLPSSVKLGDVLDVLHITTARGIDDDVNEWKTRIII